MSDSILDEGGMTSGSSRRSVPQGPHRMYNCCRSKIIRGLFRVSNVIAMLLFAASAAVQYNDDDGVLWAAIYATAGVFCVLAELSWRKLRTYIFRPLLALFATSTLIGSFYVLIARLLLRKPEGGMDDEEVYEFWGLLLVTVWMSVVLLLDGYNVVGLFRGYTSLGVELERDKEGHVQMGEVVL
ncbi:unnamed protein product [Ascophyllum nodosum]